MIDTVRLFYKFPDIVSYNDCYAVINCLSREFSRKHCLHKGKKKGVYITTAFASMGLLEVRFFKQRKINANVIQFNLKPSKFICADSYLRLSNRDKDYGLFREIFNRIVGNINDASGKYLLPELEYWRVNRIDYAVDIETPHVRAYINLFKRGFLPKGFRHYENYETSVYLTSKKCRINFYDKISQLKDTYKLTDDDIKNELAYLPAGILRLEVQCENKKIQQIKGKYNLPKNSIDCLWDEKIARDIIAHYVKAIIGRENCYGLEETVQKIREEYGDSLVCRNAYSLLLTLVKYPIATLNVMKELCQKKNILSKKGFNQLIFQIRRAKVNPIVLESICMDTGHLRVLRNPYNMLNSLRILL